jgi:N-methylhydantoinase B/oxoprolinase/acetone carboxylase alpha subunit
VQQSAEDPEKWMTKAPNCPIQKGGSVTFFTAGGGGYGAPEDRSPKLVEIDLRLRYVKE